MTDDAEISPSMQQVIAFAKQNLQGAHPLFKSIPMEVKSISSGRVSVQVSVPDSFQEGQISHGGLFTILLDTILAISTWSRMNAFVPIATLNLKTDFYAPLSVGGSFLCIATCDGIIDDVAMCQGKAINPDTDELYAQATGTFLTTHNDAQSARSPL